MCPLQAHCHRSLGTLYAKTGQRERSRAELSTAFAMYQPMVLVSYKLFNIYRSINTTSVSFWACSPPTTLPCWEV